MASVRPPAPPRLHGPSPHGLHAPLAATHVTRVRGPTERAMPPARVPSAAATPDTAQQSEHAHSRDHGSTATTRAHVILCCPRLLLIDPANAELDEAWQELPDYRHLAWAPVHQPSTNTWHPEWVCLRCNATISPQHDPPARPTMQPTWAENYRHRAWLGLHLFPQPCTAMPNSPNPHCFRGRSSQPAHLESQAIRSKRRPPTHCPGPQRLVPTRPPHTNPSTIHQTVGSMCHFSWLGQGGCTQQQLKPGATIPWLPHIGEHWCKVYRKPPRSRGNTSSTS